MTVSDTPYFQLATEVKPIGSSYNPVQKRGHVLRCAKGVNLRDRF